VFESMNLVPGIMRLVMNCVEKKFEFQTRHEVLDGAVPSSLNCGFIGSMMICQDSRFRNGTSHRVLTTQVLRNVRQLERAVCRLANFHLVEVSHLQLDEMTRADRRTSDTAVRKIQSVGNSTFVLSVENDNDFRSRCE
jgi:hypothetical protein